MPLALHLVASAPGWPLCTMLMYSQRLGDDCFVAFHDDPVLHCKFVPVREGETYSRLELGFPGEPSSLNDCTEGLLHLILCCVLSEFLQTGCGDVTHQHDFKSVIFSRALGDLCVWSS